MQLICHLAVSLSTPTVHWLWQLAANLQVVDSNRVYAYVSGMFPKDVGTRLYIPGVEALSGDLITMMGRDILIVIISRFHDCRVNDVVNNRLSYIYCFCLMIPNPNL